MAILNKGEIIIKIKLSNELISLLTELITGLNELAELIPEWNGFEKDKIINDINLTLSQLLEFREKI